MDAEVKDDASPEIAAQRVLWCAPAMRDEDAPVLILNWPERGDQVVDELRLVVPPRGCSVLDPASARPVGI